MTFYYRPTVTEAFASVQYIMTEANLNYIYHTLYIKYIFLELPLLSFQFASDHQMKCE